MLLQKLRLLLVIPCIITFSSAYSMEKSSILLNNESNDELSKIIDEIYESKEFKTLTKSLKNFDSPSKKEQFLEKSPEKKTHEVKLDKIKKQTKRRKYQNLLSKKTLEVCPDCGEAIELARMPQHYQRKHNTTPTHFCLLCNESFLHGNSLYHHTTNSPMHQQALYDSEKNKTILANKIKQHCFACTLCYLAFPNSRSLNLHYSHKHR